MYFCEKYKTIGIVYSLSLFGFWQPCHPPIRASFALKLIIQFQDQVHKDYFEVWDTVKSLQVTKTLFLATEPIG